METMVKYTRDNTSLEPIGNTDDTGEDIKQKALKALASSPETPVEVKIFPIQLKPADLGRNSRIEEITFDEVVDAAGGNSTLIFGYTAKGELYLFMVNNPTLPATVLSIEMFPLPDQAGG